MPNLSRRITKAAEESVRSQQRISDAESKIVRAIVDLVSDDDEEANPPAQPPGGNEKSPKVREPKK
jgi:hypothetical protein